MSDDQDTSAIEDGFTLLDEIARMTKEGRAIVTPSPSPMVVVHSGERVDVARVIVRKEIIPGVGVNHIELPEGSRVIHVGFGKAGQSIVHVWFECISGAPNTTRMLRTFGTGDMIPATPHMTYVGTAQHPSMRKAWHVYEEIPSIFSDFL